MIWMRLQLHVIVTLACRTFCSELISSQHLPVSVTTDGLVRIDASTFCYFNTLTFVDLTHDTAAASVQFTE